MSSSSSRNAGRAAAAAARATQRHPSGQSLVATPVSSPTQSEKTNKKPGDTETALFNPDATPTNNNTTPNKPQAQQAPDYRLPIPCQDEPARDDDGVVPPPSVPGRLRPGPDSPVAAARQQARRDAPPSDRGAAPQHAGATLSTAEWPVTLPWFLGGGPSAERTPHA